MVRHRPDALLRRVLLACAWGYCSDSRRPPVAARTRQTPAPRAHPEVLSRFRRAEDMKGRRDRGQAMPPGVLGPAAPRAMAPDESAENDTSRNGRKSGSGADDQRAERCCTRYPMFSTRARRDHVTARCRGAGERLPARWGAARRPWGASGPTDSGSSSRRTVRPAPAPLLGLSPSHVAAGGMEKLRVQVLSHIDMVTSSRRNRLYRRGPAPSPGSPRTHLQRKSRLGGLGPSAPRPSVALELKIGVPAPSETSSPVFQTSIRSCP